MKNFQTFTEFVNESKSDFPKEFKVIRSIYLQETKEGAIKITKK